jgi:starch-binding outer membrane protein SusE/F
MKKNFTQLLLSLIWVPVLLFSCQSMEQPRIIPQTGSDLVSPPSSLSLNKTDAEEKIVFNVSPADFGVSTTVTYFLQMDKPGNNFANAVDLVTATVTTLEVLVSDINTRAIARGIVPGQGGPMEFRVRAVSGRPFPALFGATASITVNTYLDAIPFRHLFLVGSATSAGWNNNGNNTPIFRDPTDPDKYAYTGFFAAGQFKLLETLGAWQPQWGTNGGNAVAVNPGGGSDPGEFQIATAGYYTFTINLQDNSFTLEPFTGNATVDYPTVGIVGDATPGGWDASTAMTKSTFDRHIWSITATLVNGEMKFRANNAWTVNWGANTALVGRATQDGPNIPVEAGSYRIWFNSLDGRYLMILQ